ncbi:uncharacterized protein LOC114296321 [Camellia sinensis]|uniref:uncharacterized protein LOC114296321 n=1 Tax=Camellia sinensis TaxID=4442 RepID=UPI0010358B4B|nr:uncharacterized protein LOC114296321 [Camellia sinensis]
MKVLSWNVRGLGKPEKMRRIRNFIKSKGVDMVLIQETKKSSIDERFVRSLWAEDELGYMEEDDRDWGPKPFKFLNAWVLHPSFLKEVENVWVGTQVEGWAGFRIMVKLRTLKQALKIWNVEVFGQVESKLKAAEAELHSWDLTAEERDLVEDEVRQKIEIRNEVWKVRKRLEWIWLQKSRLNWTLKGDKNTRYFHIMASRRHSKNVLDSLKINGTLYEDPAELKQVVAAHFKILFPEVWKIRPRLGGEFRRIDQNQIQSCLVKEFSRAEV